MRDKDRHSELQIPGSRFHVAVVFALPAEFSLWRARHAFRRISLSRHRPAGAADPAPPVPQATFEAQIDDLPVRVAFSGVGAPNAQAMEETVFAARPGVVIVAGAAGGLKPRYRCGDIIVAEQLQAAVDGRIISIENRLLSAAARCGATVAGLLLTVDRMVLRADDKAALGRTADAVDMESFVVVSEAARHGIPAVAIRVIADTAEEDLPLDLTSAIRPDGTISAPRAALQAVSQPARWPALVRAGLFYRRALGELARFLDRFVSSLSSAAL